jgi:hypothetical protein
MYYQLQTLKCVVVHQGEKETFHWVRVLDTDEEALLVCGEPLSLGEEVTCRVGDERGEPYLVLFIDREERQRLRSRPLS